MTEQNISEEPTIQVADTQNLAGPVPVLKDEDFTPPEAPDKVQVEDPIQSKFQTLKTLQDLSLPSRMKTLSLLKHQMKCKLRIPSNPMLKPL